MQRDVTVGKNKSFFMYLLINGDRLISDVQKDFSREYPYLKIEFFKKEAGVGERPFPKKMLPHYLRVKDAWSGKKNGGDLKIDGTMTVEALEHAFLDRFGLQAQLFRRSGNLWLETTITDVWTLRRQNEHGREISTDRRLPPPGKDNDYD